MLKLRMLLAFSLVLPAFALPCARSSWSAEASGGAVEPPTGPTYTNGIGMEFVLIPAGSFEMGCPSDSEACSDDEKPRHRVTISQPFYLGKFEVTQPQWESVMTDTPNPSSFKGRDRPVENVSWEDVQKFIEKLNAKEGHNRYRLPTEAEWEYAARAGSTTAYSFGDDAGRLGHYAWYLSNAGTETYPVGQKQPNAWGLHDMHGNVWEWVQDWYDANYYSAGAALDPLGPGAGEYRVLRGGSLYYDARECRSAYRGRNGPDVRSSNGGFRLALSPGR